MAKALEADPDLREADRLAWLERQVATLRAGRFDRADAAGLIEELEGMAGKLRRGLKRRLRVLLAHMLKWEHQPRRRSRSWAATIVTQRSEIEDLLEESPSLRRELEETAKRAYPQAVKLVAAETVLPAKTFPPELPYDLHAILDAPLS